MFGQYTVLYILFCMCGLLLFYYTTYIYTYVCLSSTNRFLCVYYDLLHGEIDN